MNGFDIGFILGSDTKLSYTTHTFTLVESKVAVFLTLYTVPEIHGRVGHANVHF